MAKRGKSLPFEEAREFIRSECIGSRKQYDDWYVANKPKTLPKYPNRVYTKEWNGWNDFLGTNNKFDNKKRFYRPMAEAIVWVHKQGITSKDDWLAFVKGGENLPDDIPGRPDIVYEDWRSWMHFLGNRPKEKIEAQQQVIKESAIFYVVQEREYVSQRSVFTFGTEKGGRSGLKEKWEVAKFNVIKMYEYDPEQMDAVWRVINNNSTPFYGAEKIRVCPNVNQLVWDIAEYLNVVR